MNAIRPTGLIGLLLFVLNVSPLAAQSVKPAAALSPEAMERFLLTAKMVSSRDAGDGITNSQLATFTDGTITHDVHIQTIDEFKMVVNTPRMSEVNFRDTYRYNIAAYRLAMLLGMDNVPMSVERNINRRQASVTWWIDDVLMSERERIKTNDEGPDASRYAMQVHLRRVFDELIQNRDRNVGNIIWTKDWKMWLIDHTRAFRLSEDLVNPPLLQRCDQALCAALKTLTVDRVKTAVGRSLMSNEVEALVARAEAIVKHFDGLVAERGEGRVMYTFMRPGVRP
jgi:hypothetical protein